MEAIIFRITRVSTKEVVYEGIVDDSDATIFPMENICDEKGELYTQNLPSECEMHKFHYWGDELGYAMESHAIDMTWEQAMKFKVTRW